MPKLDQCLTPPFTMIPPPGHALVEIVKVEKTRSGIILVEDEADPNAPGGFAGRGQPIAKIVKMGPSRLELCGTPIAYNFGEGDYVMVGPHAPMMKVMEDYAVLNLDGVIVACADGEDSRGHLYTEEALYEEPVG